MSEEQPAVPAVSADKMALRVVAVMMRNYMTYTALVSAFFFIMGGFAAILETLPQYSTLGLVPTALVEIGLLCAGLFLGFGVAHQIAKKLYLLNHPPAPKQPPVKKE